MNLSHKKTIKKHYLVRYKKNQEFLTKNFLKKQ